MGTASGSRDRNHITSIEDAPLHEGDWLILARTNDKLNKLKPYLKDMAIYFEIKGRKSYKTRLYKALQITHDGLMEITYLYLNERFI